MIAVTTTDKIVVTTAIAAACAKFDWLTRNVTSMFPNVVIAEVD